MCDVIKSNVTWCKERICWATGIENINFLGHIDSCLLNEWQAKEGKQKMFCLDSEYSEKYMNKTVKLEIIWEI